MGRYERDEGQKVDIGELKGQGDDIDELEGHEVGINVLEGHEVNINEPMGPRGDIVYIHFPTIRSRCRQSEGLGLDIDKLESHESRYRRAEVPGS